jgi:CheY-like chemotaxis protein
MLLDMHMPEMDGLQLAQEIRKDPYYSGVPLLMLSSLCGISENNELCDSILDAWLTKPVSQSKLHNTLVSILNQAKGKPRHNENEQKTEVTDPSDPVNRIRILLAEDNEVNQVIAKEMLKSLGYETTVAKSGLEAVSTFQSQKFDLVLMDCRMPELDGYDATRAIRQWEDQRKLAPTSIVALTANAVEGDREECLSAGMDDYLSKPFTKEQLNDVVTLNSH